jgi:hypothetical protein
MLPNQREYMDRLSALLAGQPAMGAPGLALPPAGGAPAAAPMAAAPAAAINPGAGVVIPPAPAAPQYEALPIDRLRQLQDQRAGIQAPNPNDPKLKAKWWERLIAAASAGAMSWGAPQNAPLALEMAGRINDRRYNSAMNDYNAQVNPLDKQIEQERGNIPLITALNEQRHREYTDQLGGRGSKLDEFNAVSQDTDRKGRLKVEQDKLAKTGGEDFIPKDYAQASTYALKFPKGSPERVMWENKAKELYRQEMGLRTAKASENSGLPGLTEAQNRQYRILRETLEPEVAMARAAYNQALKNDEPEQAAEAKAEVKRLMGIMKQKLDGIKPGLSGMVGLDAPTDDGKPMLAPTTNGFTESAPKGPTFGRGLFNQSTQVAQAGNKPKNSASNASTKPVQSEGSKKVASKAQVRKFAKENNVSYTVALKHFQDSSYQVE